MTARAPIPEHFSFSLHRANSATDVQQMRADRVAYVPVHKTNATLPTLAQAIYLSGLVPAPALCNGLGLCGQCKLLYLSPAPASTEAETQFFTPEQLAQGWRLGCQQYPAPDIQVAIIQTVRSIIAPKKIDTLSKNLSLAIDVGTTNLHWQLLKDTTVVWEDQCLNPQMGAGSEIMSRLHYAQQHKDGARTLQNRLLDALRELVDLAKNIGTVQEICLTANPAMLALLLHTPLDGLLQAPYRLDYSGGKTEQCEGLPPLWIPPQLAPFVGADSSAGYLALCTASSATAMGLNSPAAYPFLLTDMGTNGEFVLALSPTEALVTSIPLGPALEGIGLHHGTVASPTAITNFSLRPTGLLPQTADGKIALTASGISGTGYLSLLAILLQLKIIQTDGRFTQQHSTQPQRALVSKLSTPIQDSAGYRLPLPANMALYAKDIEEILKVKAAFSVAVATLLSTAHLRPQQLTGIYIGGALGKYCPSTVLENLGFLPAGMSNKLYTVGNCALAGASLLLQQPHQRDILVRWAQQTSIVAITQQADFLPLFLNHMYFTFESYS